MRENVVENVNGLDIILMEQTRLYTPSIKYDRWKKIYEEKIFAEDQDVRTFSSRNQKNNNSSNKPLTSMQRKINTIYPIIKED